MQAIIRLRRLIPPIPPSTDRPAPGLKIAAESLGTVAEEDLHGAQIAGLLLDDGGFGASKWMRPVVARTQTDAGYPLIDEARILPGADVLGVINPAGEHEVIERPASAFEPCKNAVARRLEEFEPNRSIGLLLNDDCP